MACSSENDFGFHTFKHYVPKPALWREGFLAGDTEGYVEKALETGSSFHRGPGWGTWRRAYLLGTLREGWRGLWGWGFSICRGSVEGALVGGALPWEPWKVCSDSLRIWASLSIGAHIAPRGTWCLRGRLVYQEIWKMDEGGLLTGEL